jgi:Ca2+-transporting ATPase
MNNTEAIPFHTLPSEEVLQLLETGMDGLEPSQAQSRLEKFGYNELTAAPKISPLKIFLRQFKNILIIILIVATAISFFLGEHLDAWVILGILAACAILGFYQEYTAEQAALALKKMAAATATVIREGKEEMIPARETAPGDILVLHAGDRVAADGRLLTQFNLMADEAALTGESTPVVKKTDPLTQAEAPLGDRFCMVFGGTVITYGRGLAVVTSTGMNTEFGHIARMLGEVEEKKTPLEARMDTIGRVLSAIALAVAAGASIMGVFRGYGWLEMLIWGISLAVAAVPEALPAVVTGALSIGTTRMARKKAIVKRLPAVETMGCTTVICTDKTGTLTRNEMVARRVFLEGQELEVTGSGYEPAGTFREEDRELDPSAAPVLQQAARIALLCNDAVLKEEGGAWKLRGDPTEGALAVLGRKAGFDPDKLALELPRVGEIPFASERQMMTTMHREHDRLWAYVKGAPERVLARSSRILTGEGEKALMENERRRILEQAGDMAGQALRVLGLAYRPLAALPDPEPEKVETDLVWVGLAGLMDPPRPEAAEAVALCHQAGIRVIMVTGDHPVTAGAVAREIGLIGQGSGVRGQGSETQLSVIGVQLSAGGEVEENINKAGGGRLTAGGVQVITGAEFNQLTDEELKEALREVGVFARVAPEHKLRLVKILKEQGEIVAMTGDGVNDAPALKRADIGVAMGITGTEVTKETAAMILADDNFATLVAAVEEGRAIFDNIKKYLIFLLSCNLAEIFVLTGAFFMGMPLPLVAIQILMVNLTTDGLPALALGVDPKAPDIMRRPPRSPEEGVFTRSVNVLLGVISIYIFLTLVAVFAYYFYWNPGGHDGYQETLNHAQTMVFIGFVLFEMVNAFNCRHDYHSLFTVGFFRNRFLVAAVVLSLLIIFTVVQWPPLSDLFHTVPLSLQDWLLAAALSLPLIPVVEMAKWVLRRRLKPINT